MAAYSVTWFQLYLAFYDLVKDPAHGWKVELLSKTMQPQNWLNLLCRQWGRSNMSAKGKDASLAPPS